MPRAMGTARLQHLNWDLDVREKALWNASLWVEWGSKLVYQDIKIVRYSRCRKAQGVPAKQSEQ